MLRPDMTDADKNCDQFEFHPSREVENHVEILTEPQTPQDTNLIKFFSPVIPKVVKHSFQLLICNIPHIISRMD